ncbi:hypothetical protein [Streptomyces morookaense]|uniref:Uncharacterized protein n=1 Tax=Streptomyces morookaense TaxID=1970 RepID=A0A7Y7B888_STRMO|nr:hypothetical protein [Streptomyces morookaense]NVK80396.1 hypothetical protein [Streptomyces morookaense]GHF14318.1 hypothetical protein GCM10010359_14510 [Streptomyces morookaense]
MPIEITPRPINTAERAILEKLLSVDFVGVEELRLQIDFCEVTGIWGQDSVSVDLRTSDSSPQSPAGTGPIPVRTSVLGESGSLEGEILIWVTDGYLSALEYAWYGETMPRELPPAERVTIDE